MLDFLKALVVQGGPLPADFGRLTEGLRRMAEAGVPAAEIRAALAPTLTTDSLQGWAYLKPHGYPGDFEMIDRIYTDWRSPDPRLTRWDDYFQSQSAPRAVRNRKRYFQRLLAELERSAAERPAVLVVGCGPARDVADYFADAPESRVLVHAIDLDPRAIEHAGRLCRAPGDRILLESRNPRRFRPARRYDLIWCPGLFDYFDDALFVGTLARFLPHLAPGGELIVGNFAAGNPTRWYMELVGDWHLRYRTAGQLHDLARQADLPEERIHVAHEPEGVNLFLHLRHADAASGANTAQRRSAA